MVLKTIRELSCNIVKIKFGEFSYLMQSYLVQTFISCLLQLLSHQIKDQSFCLQHQNKVCPH